ncbi:MAG: hypothetical protein R3B06_04720 [Kofleriaceae bacterium]
MTDNLTAMLAQLRLTPAVVKAIPALVARYGGAGAVALARGYLGPLAPPAGKADGCVPAGTHATTPRTVDGQPVDGQPVDGQPVDGQGASKLASADAAVLGLALAKLVYELGELALHNPTFDPKGAQPDFKLDDRGRTPAMSVTHVVAVARLLKAASAAVEASPAPTTPATPQARLQAARAQRYATTPRYSYVARPATYRAPR